MLRNPSWGTKRGSGRLGWAALKKCDSHNQKRASFSPFSERIISTQKHFSSAWTALAHAAESGGSGGGGSDAINCDPPSLLSATMATAAFQSWRRVLADVRLWVVLLQKEWVLEREAPRSPGDHHSAFKQKHVEKTLALSYRPHKATVSPSAHLFFSSSVLFSKPAA